MAGRIDEINIHPKGIGQLLKDETIWVPPNQRDYSWKDKHVESLYDDLNLAISKHAAEYFLGTIVAIHGADGKVLVVDGQQRLATTLILLAAIRDFHDTSGDANGARLFESTYVLSQHYLKKLPQPHLYLNERDRDYFLKRVLLPKSDARRKQAKPSKRDSGIAVAPSHRLIDKAAKIAAKRIQTIIAGFTGTNQADKLDEWVEFLRTKAKVIWITVPDESSAYLIFETMNDRGLELSASDLIKNYLFGRAEADNLDTVKHNWSQMLGALDTVAGTEVKDYVRHFWVSRHGIVRSQELFDAIKNEVKSPTDVLETSAQLQVNAVKYAALLNPTHSTWNRYSRQARKAVATLKMLGIKQTRPLLLTALDTLTPKEMAKLLDMAIIWSVRLLIGGIQGSGPVEAAYANAAQNVSNKTYTTAAQVKDEMMRVVPKDDRFLLDFTEASVTQAALARYYLAILERRLKGSKDIYYSTDEDITVTLEHIMPEARTAKWAHVPEDKYDDHTNRIGNLALLDATANSAIGSEGWDVKKPVLQSAKIRLTKETSKSTAWGISEIDDRQERLAKLAVKAWPL
ncbi:MAG: DUF262 domain-containing HNH endonuclease family protein [Acidobacteriia bacterium]|nr:DUF262 domain-containing HNH endonuclease family protein [Terriglobia bacterium]